jgi:hypothetical protein
VCPHDETSEASICIGSLDNLEMPSVWLAGWLADYVPAGGFVYYQDASRATLFCASIGVCVRA